MDLDQAPTYLQYLGPDLSSPQLHRKGIPIFDTKSSRPIRMVASLSLVAEVRAAFEASRVTRRQADAFDRECNCTKAIM